MEKIELININVKKSDAIIHFSVSEGLKKYFRDDELRLRYPVDCDEVPESLMAVPFVANVITIVWVADCELIIPQLDKAFYKCLEKVKSGYEKMFPKLSFKGSIRAKDLVENKCATGRCAMFYSGGLDSVDTFVRHVDEKPDLISIWGSDIKYDNMRGWNVAHDIIKHTAEDYQFADFVVRSSFRDQIDTGALNNDYRSLMDDNWWHGLQHSLGLLGHVAPLAYMRGYEKMYIASSFTTETFERIKVKCASNPFTDNEVRFCNCRVVHDGPDCSRMDKTANVVRYCSAHSVDLPLHVCWESQSGGNCGVCEKCLRTIVMLISQGADPVKYGFSDFKDKFFLERSLRVVRETCYKNRKLGNTQYNWTCSSEALKVHPEYCDSYAGDFAKFLCWVRDADFNSQEFREEPSFLKRQRLQHRIRQILSKIYHGVIR